MPTEEVYTVEEVATILKVSQKWVIRQIIANKIRAFKTGHKYRVTRSALNEFMGEAPRKEPVAPGK